MRLFGRRPRRRGPVPRVVSRQVSPEEAEVGRRIEEYAVRLRRLTPYSVGSGLRDCGYLPTTERVDGGYPFYRFEDGRYVLAVHERGQDSERADLDSPDELLYRIFEGVAFSLSVEWELRHRVEGPDPRRVLFPMAERLMTALEPGWGERLAAEHARILRDHPYSDE